MMLRRSVERPVALVRLPGRRVRMPKKWLKLTAAEGRRPVAPDFVSSGATPLALSGGVRAVGAQVSGRRLLSGSSVT